MTVTECRYINLKDGYSLVYCEFDVGKGRVIRCVETKNLLIEPSTFIGLKFHPAIDLDTTKQLIIKKKLNLVDLFSDNKENIQLGLF